MAEARSRQAPSADAGLASQVSADRIRSGGGFARNAVSAFAVATAFLNVKSATLERVGLVAIGALLVLLLVLLFSRKIRRATLRQNSLAEDRLEEIATSGRPAHLPTPMEIPDPAVVAFSDADTQIISRRVGGPGMFAPRKSPEQEAPKVSGTPPWDPAPRPPEG
jgi:hypothetical protein